MSSSSIPAPRALGPLQTFFFRQVFNLWPCMRGAGGRVTHLARDFTRITVRLRLNWRTRNAVGTIFGGSMFSSTDPMYMLMLQRLLGRDYVVWDKSCFARFKRPGKTTLFADFHVTPEMLAEVRAAIAAGGEAEFTWPILFKDAAGVVHAEFDKTVYVADKAFYKRKLSARASPAQ